MSDYSEMVKEAKKLKVSKAYRMKLPELEKAIVVAKTASDKSLVDEVPKVSSDTFQSPETSKDETPEKFQGKKFEAPKKSQSKKVEKKFNTVIIWNKKMEVRRYSLEAHGKKFADLAAQFAKKKGFGLETAVVGDKIQCPSCGHRFNV